MDKMKSSQFSIESLIHLPVEDILMIDNQSFKDMQLAQKWVSFKWTFYVRDGNARFTVVPKKILIINF